jgi:hypothetical protein
MTWGPRHDAFIIALRSRYLAMLPTLSRAHDHCHEVACLALALAPRFGLHAELRMGQVPARRRPGQHTFHAWAELPDGAVIHSPERGKVEVGLRGWRRQ